MADSIGILFGVFAMFGWGLADFLAAIALKRGIMSEKLYFFVQLLGIIPIVLLATMFLDVPVLSIEIIVLVLLAAFLTLTEYIFLYKAFDIGPVSLAAPLCASYPMLTVIFSVIFLKEILSIDQILLIALVILGVILISLDLSRIRKLKLAYSKTGLWFAFISVLASGILFTLLGYLIKQIGWFAPIFFMKFLVVIYLFPYLKTKGIGLKITGRFLWMIISAMALLEVFAYLTYSVGAFVFLNSIVVPISASYPLVTIVLARIFFKEKIMPSQYLGIFLVLLGVVLLSFI
jgi:drug/metabolite transporter (DMT)-like permease